MLGLKVIQREAADGIEKKQHGAIPPPQIANHGQSNDVALDVRVLLNVFPGGARLQVDKALVNHDQHMLLAVMKHLLVDRALGFIDFGACEHAC